MYFLFPKTVFRSPDKRGKSVVLSYIPNFSTKTLIVGNYQICHSETILMSIQYIEFGGRIKELAGPVCLLSGALVFASMDVLFKFLRQLCMLFAVKLQIL